MPTPSGLAKKGDIVTRPDGRQFKVLARLGNDSIYAVRLVPADDNPLPADVRARGYLIVTEFPYWLSRGWKLSNPT